MLWLYFSQNFEIFLININFVDRNGCAIFEDMLWKLDVLQSFIREFYWFDEMFVDYFDYRFKLMVVDMIEVVVKRLEILYS